MKFFTLVVFLIFGFITNANAVTVGCGGTMTITDIVNGSIRTRTMTCTCTGSQTGCTYLAGGGAGTIKPIIKKSVIAPAAAKASGNTGIN